MRNNYQACAKGNPTTCLAVWWFIPAIWGEMGNDLRYKFSLALQCPSCSSFLSI